VSDDRLKIAVFIDFDNIEIGVKSTLGTHFDIGSVLEAIKERGEIVTKVAYGDWTRAGDYGRSLSQHAVHMVQRNLTPGGDKNGADINLALDALEMAFTHNHINSFVIVSGDSDFISLVEKLKQYDRKVFVLGGRAFTSVVMQKNCTEFMAYENIVGRGRGVGRARSGGESPLSQAMPLVRRALKLLADREVLPQLGLLKSTLLQLDSAFSEKEYGASSFRDFVQKLANAGLVTLKGSERSFQVELPETGEAPTMPPAAAATPSETPDNGSHAGDSPRPTPVRPPRDASRAAPSPAAMSDALRVVQEAVASAGAVRWPLYVRQVKQLIRTADPQFDERRYGFGNVIDFLKQMQREGALRVERDRQGVVRVWPGTQAARPASADRDAAVADAGSMTGEPLPPGDLAAREMEGPDPAEPELAVTDETEAGSPDAARSTGLPVVEAELAESDAAALFTPLQDDLASRPPREGSPARTPPEAAPARGRRRAATSRGPRARKTTSPARRPRTTSTRPTKKREPDAS
jgi:uncharacterized LabA/DUF88 family protein